MSGTEVRARRIQLGLTQEELAARLGVATNTLARWERGESPVSVVVEMALRSLEAKS